ncbi:hypothetical protein MMC17_005118 [Xylographa soralifera]|nr:hypothetical protein [Xylographa soralifera]
MASHNPLKRNFEATGLQDSVEGTSETFMCAHPHTSFSNVQSQPGVCNVVDILGEISRETSPLSSTATSTTRENSAAPAVSTVTTTSSTSKRRKLTFAEKEVVRIEKQYKEQQKAKEKARKDEEKRAKEEERRIKEEETKEAKRKRDEEREEKRKLREAEIELKTEEKRKREAEKKAKDDDKAKKERSQLRLNSFFTKPTAHVGGYEGHDRSGPSSRRSSTVSLEGEKPNIRSRSASLLPDQDVASDYTRTFPPFFVHAHTDVAPPSRFTCNDRDTASYDYGIDTMVSQSTDFGGTASARLRSSLGDLFRAPNKRRRITPLIISVKDIVASFHGSAADPIDLTQTQKTSQRSPADLLKTVPVKYLRYVEDVRPPYIGTYSKIPVKCSPSRLLRRPFLRALPGTNYDYDSEAEWEEPEEGEDLDSEGEEEIGEEEIGDDMEEFLDDDDAEGYGAKRRNLMGDVQPVCTGVVWDGAVDRAKSNVIAYGDTTLDLRPFRMELLFNDAVWPLNPYSTSYWPMTQSGAIDNSTRSPTTMAPPRVPLSIINKSNNILPSSSPHLGTDTKIGDANCFPLKPSTIKPRNSVPSKPIPSDLLEDFKKAIDGSDLTKAGLIEVLKKKFPSITKGTVQDTIALVADRVGKKESDKRWRLLHIAAGLIGVGGAAISISTALFGFGDSVVKARKQIYQLATELAHFSIAPKALAAILHEHGSLFKPDLLADADVYRQDCDSVLQDIKTELGDLDAHSLSILDRAKWFFREEKVNLQKARLERAKASLTLMIGVLNLAACLQRDSSKTEDYQNDVRQQYENAKVFVVVADKAYQDVSGSDVDIELPVNGSELSMGQQQLKVREGRVSSTAIARLLPKSHVSDSSSALNLLKISEEAPDDTNDPAINNDGAQVVSIKQTEVQTPQVVRKLLLCWTNVEDVSALPAAPSELIIGAAATGPGKHTNATPAELEGTPITGTSEHTSEIPSATRSSTGSATAVPEKGATPSRERPPVSSSGVAPEVDTNESRNQTEALPKGWQRMRTESGRDYFVDHNTKTTSWNLPMVSNSNVFNPGTPGTCRRIECPVSKISLYQWTPPINATAGVAPKSMEIAYLEKPGYYNGEPEYKQFFRERKMLCFWLPQYSYFAIDYERTDQQVKEAQNPLTITTGVSNVISVALFNLLYLHKGYLVQHLMQASEPGTRTDTLYKHVCDAKRVFAQIMSKHYKLYMIKQPIGQQKHQRTEVLTNKWSEEIAKIADSTYDHCIQIVLNAIEDPQGGGPKYSLFKNRNK